MKQFIRPSLIVWSIGLLMPAAIVTFFTVPLITELSTSRKTIDLTRSTIATVEKQQQNIDIVSQEFSQLTEQDELLDKLFLNEDRSVEFFNSLDTLFSTNGITGQTVKIDSPQQTASKYQTLNVTITFSTKYAALIHIIRQLQSLEPLILTQSITTTERGGNFSDQSVTLNGLVLWENS